MKAYIIPGFQESIHDQGYSEIFDGLVTAKYDVTFLNLQIKNNSLSKLISNAIAEHSFENSLIVGFSNGALLAYLISTLVPVQTAIICTISDIIGEDTNGIMDYLSETFGEETAMELKNTEYNVSKAKNLIFINGENEKYTTDRVNKLLALNKNAKQYFVEEVEHELNSNYVKKILSLV